MDPEIKVSPSKNSQVNKGKKVTNTYENGS